MAVENAVWLKAATRVLKVEIVALSMVVDDDALWKGAARRPKPTTDAKLMAVDHDANLKDAI